MNRLPGSADRRLALFLGACVIGVFAFWGAWKAAAVWFGKSGEELLTEARSALTNGRFSAAQDLASQIPSHDPFWAQGRLIAGEAAAAAKQPEQAMSCYREVPRDGTPDAVVAALSLAELCRDLGRLTDAEEAYGDVLAQQPGNPAVHERMAFVYNVSGRRWESLPHFLELIRRRSWTLESLALLGDLERPVEEPDYLKRCVENAPDDVLVRMGLAAQLISEGRSIEAREQLERIVETAPERVAAQAMLGGLLVNGDDEAFLRWHARLPPNSNQSPDVWYIRGLRARRLGEMRVAARCFWESVHSAPTHRRSTYLLGQVLTTLGHEGGPLFADRAGQLSELTRELDQVLRSEGRHEASMRRVVELMESCGRIWEAWAWGMTAARYFPRAEWPGIIVERTAPQLHMELPQVVRSADLAIRYDFSGFPGPESLFGKPGSEAAPTPSAGSLADIRFQEEDSVGVRFVYNNGGDLSTSGTRMFEQTGGGVGVIDFDLDGCPDLYFPQGSEWKSGELTPTRSAAFADCLSRNLGGESFVEVTGAAGTGDLGFGQGCAVGDFDNDGHPDLYVGNVGRNTLYQNNGDGTFTDVTEAAGLVGEDWTASCVIVDLNADGLPDLYDANYLAGQGVYDRICNGRGCSPKNFPGAPGRLHLNEGDGTFRHVENATPRDNSKGLGVVAFDLLTRGRPSLFIANDQVPNFLLRNLPSDDENNVRLQEDAFLSGLAFNMDGLAMAGMGVAAEDIDGNHLLDFFVTNFKDESNTLYLQDSPGLFVDTTQAADLTAPSWPYVGWGTQFLDADLDGNPDLVLVNGHIDDYRDEGGEYHMRPQFFRNLGHARFAELPAEEAGPYFGKKFLGRGLSRLDWNRDGRMDFVVSNIGQPASLLTNHTEGAGHFLNVRLHATITARDAIGAVAEVKAGDGHWTKQLVAGDGFMASNERVLQFGLGSAERVEELQVRWPSGEVATLRDLPVDVTIELVERQTGELRISGARH